MIQELKNVIHKYYPKSIPCKSPLEIQRMLQSFETRHINLTKTIPDLGLTMKQRDKILRLEAKIHILKNILKYTD